jgi:hypothetical protein
VDTFIPQPSAWGFTGDGRGFPNLIGGSFRTELLFDANGTEISFTMGISRLGPLSARGNKSRSGTAPMCGGIHAWAAGSDGLFFGLAPNAEYDLYFGTDSTGAVTSVTGRATPYPAIEAWEYSDNLPPRLLYYRSAEGYGPGDLFWTVRIR